MIIILRNLNSHQHAVLYTSVALLFYAVLSALSGQRWLGYDVLFNFYTHYGEGYVHRGFVGTLFLLLFGGLEPDKLRELIAPVEIVLLVVEMFLLWLLLMPRIVLYRNFSPLMRWLLLSFVAVILLSPTWSTSVSFLGWLDKWFFFFSLLATAAFIFRRPVAFAVLLVLSIMVHRGGFFFAAMLALLVWHAVLRIPEFQKRRLTWILASIIPLLAFFVLGVLNDQDAMLQVLQQSKGAALYDVNNPNVQIITRSGGEDVRFIIENILIFPKGIILSLLLFWVPIAFVAVLFVYSYSRAGLGFGELSDSHSRLSALAKRIEFLLPLAATMAPLPIILFAIDWGRFLYWGWLILGLVLAYHIWYLKVSVPKRLKKPRQKAPRLLKTSIFAVALTAFVYGGSPLLFPWQIILATVPCVRYCAIAEHLPGRLFRDMSLKVLVPSYFPFRMDVAKYPNATIPVDSYISKHWKREVQDGRLLVPGGYDGKLYRQVFWLYPQSIFHFTVEYGGSDNVPFELFVNSERLTPVKVDKNKVLWAAKVPNGQRYEFRLRASGNNNGFYLKSYSMDVKIP